MKILRLFCTWSEKDNLTQLNIGKLRKAKNSSLVYVTFGGHFLSSIISYRNVQQKPNTTKFQSVFNLNKLQAILDGSHFQNHTNGYYDLIILDRDLQQKPNTTKFG